MLLTDFYKITSVQTGQPTAWTVDLELNPSHSIYKGHFPHHPVLPGVCTLQIIKECISDVMNIPIQYAQIASCKFLSAIDPTVTPRMRLSLTTKELEGNQLQLWAEGASEGTDFIKLKATFIVKE